MKMIIGKFVLPISTFDFSLLNSNGEALDFKGLLRCKDINDNTVNTITIIHIGNSYGITVNGTSNIFTGLTNFRNGLQTLFGSEINGIGIIYMDESNTALITAVESIIDTTDKTNCIFLFRSKSPRDTVTKELDFVRSSEIKYTRTINHKRLQIDMLLSVNDEKFNYAYLTVLNRYYYIEDIMLTNNYGLLTLNEDVLMSFADLIRLQTAYVERNQYNIDYDKVDDLVTYDYDKEITYTTINPLVDLYCVNTLLPSLMVVITVDGRTVPVTP